MASVCVREDANAHCASMRAIQCVGAQFAAAVWRGACAVSPTVRSISEHATRSALKSLPSCNGRVAAQPHKW